MNRVVSWFAANHVAANLLMILIVGAGFMSTIGIRKEVFPELLTNMVSVRVPYLGAGPEEVEQGICLVVEEAVNEVDGVERVTSVALEGMGSVVIELREDADAYRVLDDIKSAVDRITTLPENAEKPEVSLSLRVNQVVNIVVYGDAPERTLKVLAERVRDDLTKRREITKAEIAGVRNYEISIEVSEETLRRHRLSLGDITRAARRASIDMPGGEVKTDGGEILVRTKGRKYTGEEYADVVLLTRPDGTKLRLGEIATIIDGFEDVANRSRFDGKPASIVQVFRVGEESVLDVAASVKEYIAEAEGMLPEGVSLSIWGDRSKIYQDRLNLLTRNGSIGLVLVFIVLAMAMQFRLAFWVALGIPISFLGAFWLIPQWGVSLNMISLFAFIVALGLVVDDAIVVGENVFTQKELGKGRLKASVDGTVEVLTPVIFSVLTTIAAFLPLTAVTGTMGQVMRNIPIVVIAVLALSLVECLLILPAHLTVTGIVRRTDRKQWVFFRSKDRFQDWMRWFIREPYTRTLAWALERRYIVLATSLALLLVTVGLFAGGFIKFTLMPKVDADNVVVALTMPEGTPATETEAVLDQIVGSLDEVEAHFAASRPEDAPRLYQHVYAVVGSQPRSAGRFGPMGGSAVESGSNVGEINLQLLFGEDRDISSIAIARRWRRAVGEIPGVSALKFSSDLFHGSNPIDIQLSSPRTDDLIAAADHIKTELADYPGISDISDTFREGKTELRLALKPEAEFLGIRLDDLARQVRQAFYGDEALRIQRARDEVKVMVRYPTDERRSLGNIESMRIRTPDGVEIPFATVAEVTLGPGYAAINRADRARVVSVQADVDPARTNSNEVLAHLAETIFPMLTSDYPGLNISMEGQQQDQRESLASLGRGFILALFMIYALLAIPFRSYLQPLIVMSAIPFGIVGAVLGHLGMGWDLSLLSLFGVVALSGVVVNDSLILTDFINRARRRGLPLRDAVIEAGQRRFRPVTLTSITTFAGLTPMLLEKSMQARFLIPMAISLGWGIIFATGITLVLVPVGYVIVEDAIAGGRRLLGLRPADLAKVEAARETD